MIIANSIEFKHPLYLVVGCPGSGKSWVCDQLKGAFHYVHHDLFIGMAGDTYVRAIIAATRTADRAILIEAPFSLSQIMEPLEAHGLNVVPVFIQEDPSTIKSRYLQRERKEIPKGHLTRQQTYLERAKKLNAFYGTSTEVLAHLRAKLSS